MTSKYLIPDTDDDADLGPAMRKCSKQERIFVRALFDKPGHGAGARSARAAGYGNKNSPNVTYWRAANRLFNRPRVTAAIAEMSGQLLRSDAPMAVKTVREIMKDKNHKDRLKAARTIIERASPVEQRFSGEMRHTLAADRIDHTAEAVRQLAYFKSQGANREFLLNMFGFSGLSRYEKLLAEQEAAAAENPANGVRQQITDAEFVELPRPPNRAIVVDDDDDEG